jgi:hypothetical protein
MQAPPGSVVAIATDAGSVASDGSGRNSPYAAALARYMQQPGLELQGMFKAVAQSVYDATKNTQTPQIPVQTYKLTPTFYFRAASVQPAAGPLPPPARDPRGAEVILWQSAQSIGTADAYRDYLSRYPDGQFSTQAKLAIDKLSQPNSSDPQQQRPRSLDIRECTLLAQRQTGYDPSLAPLRVQYSLGGLSPRAAIVWGPDPHVPSASAAAWEQAQKYANALGACFQARGYTLQVKQCVQIAPARCQN